MKNLRKAWLHSPPGLAPERHPTVLIAYRVHEKSRLIEYASATWSGPPLKFCRKFAHDRVEGHLRGRLGAYVGWVQPLAPIECIAVHIYLTAYRGRKVMCAGSMLEKQAFLKARTGCVPLPLPEMFKFDDFPRVGRLGTWCWCSNCNTHRMVREQDSHFCRACGLGMDVLLRSGLPPVKHPKREGRS